MSPPGRKKRGVKRRSRPPQARIKSRPKTNPPPAPEISTGFGPAGRETLAAIAEELAPGYQGEPFESETSGPEIEIGQTRPGRETLAAIDAELQGEPSDAEEPATRVRKTTVGYEHAESVEAEGDLPRNTLPGGFRGKMRTFGFSEVPAPPETDVPADAATGEARTGAPQRRAQNTLESIERELDQWARTGQLRRAPAEEAGGFEVHEMVTFVVRGDLTRLSSVHARREFVMSHLMHRLPAADMDEVERIDVTPWTVRGTVIVRVWCRVSQPDAAR